MGLSNSNLLALKIFPPSSIADNTLGFFEFLKYETKPFRDDNVVSKDDLLDAISKSIKIRQPPKSKKSNITKQFEEFTKALDRTLFIKNSKDEILEIKWKQIDSFCSLLRLVERSDERKIRWALYNEFSSGALKIPKKRIFELLKDFKINILIKSFQKFSKQKHCLD